MVSVGEIETKLKENLLPGALVRVEDIPGGCGNSYELLIVSDEFDKKSPLMRHRKIHGILKEEVPLIHALTLNVYTVAQYENIKIKEKAESETKANQEPAGENAETAANQDKADKEDPDVLSQ